MSLGNLGARRPFFRRRKTCPERSDRPARQEETTGQEG